MLSGCGRPERYYLLYGRSLYYLEGLCFRDIIYDVVGLRYVKGAADESNGFCNFCRVFSLVSLQHPQTEQR